MVATVGTNAPLSMPTAAMPIDEGGQLIASQVWWRFWYGLYKRTAASIPYLVGSGLTATGTTQANALALPSEWNEVTTTASNTGVILNAFGVGFNSIVFNAGANTLKIYPPVGCAIDALGTNNPYSLASGASRDFYQLTATQFRSR